MQQEVRELIEGHVRAGRPLGCWCIAPALVAASLRGEPKVKLTVGKDKDTASAMEALGATHVDCEVSDCVVDEEHRVVSTPAYMYDAEIHQVRRGIEKAVDVLHGWLS